MLALIAKTCRHKREALARALSRSLPYNKSTYFFRRTSRSGSTSLTALANSRAGYATIGLVAPPKFGMM
jgi:hypothetical protein